MWHHAETYDNTGFYAGGIKYEIFFLNYHFKHHT